MRGTPPGFFFFVGKDTYKKYFSFLFEKIHTKNISLSLQEKKILEQALFFVYNLTDGKKRKNGDNEFTHIIDVIHILLDDFEEVVFEDIFLAILHDTIEDYIHTENEPTRDVLRERFGSTVTDQIEVLSKRHRIQYIYQLDENKLSPDELKQVQDFRSRFYSIHPSNSDTIDPIQINCILITSIIELADESASESLKKKLKDIRNRDYYGNMSSLLPGTLKVKLADRIAGLRTLHGFGTKEKIIHKLEETVQYFLTPSKQYPLVYREIVERITQAKVDFIISNEEFLFPLSEENDI